MLDFELSGDAAGDYGSLDVTGLATLAGALGIDLEGFKLELGDSFDLLASTGVLSGGLGSLWLDGAACSEASGDAWSCGGYTLDLNVMDGAGGFVDLSVAAIPGPGGATNSGTIDLGDAPSRLPRARRARAAQGAAPGVQHDGLRPKRLAPVGAPLTRG